MSRKYPNPLKGPEDGAILTAEQTRLLESISLPIMMLDRELRFVYANAPYLAATHSKIETLLGRDVFECFPETPDRVEAVRSKFSETIVKGITTQLDAQPFILELDDGSFSQRVWQATQDPIRNADGDVIGLIQRAEDITQQYELAQQNMAMKKELHHRVKNIMAVVTSIARISGRDADNVKDFIRDFVQRLRSLARSNTMLAQDQWQGLSVQRIIEAEMAVFDDAPDFGLTVKGPNVRLSLQATKDLFLVVHELCTNALKYGALNKRGGSLSATWSRQGDTLTLNWVETCAEPISPPSGTIGFGTRLIEMLPYVEAKRDFREKGLHMTITVTGETAFARTETPD